jgi:hypothetical protein
MPTTIPYDPSLILGNIVEKNKIQVLEDIANAQKGMCNAQDYLNALLLYKRSLDMTKQELIQMQINTNELDTGIADLTKKIADAATAYGTAVIQAQSAILKLKNQNCENQINVLIESPIDYNKSVIKQLQLSSDSMSMDVQFFREDTNMQSGEDHSNQIATFVAGKMKDLFDGDTSFSIGASTKSIVTQQRQKTGYQGTLVLTATCTHKMADVFAPLIIDVDKAIHAWNAYHVDDTTKQIDTDNRDSILNAAKQPSSNEAGMFLLSGATYGSSFVGMVHIFSLQSTTVSQKSDALASSFAMAESTANWGSWLAEASGKFGIDTAIANALKNLLSIATLTSHCSVVTMGIIPSIKSNKVTTVVKALSGDPQKHMEELAVIQGATNTDMTTLASSAKEARDAQSLSTLSTEYMKAAVDAVGDMDKQENQVIDTNSMMTAFDDYVTKASSGNCGVPINFLLKPITQKQIAKAWVDKYYPNEFRTYDILGDSSGNTTNTNNGGNTTNTNTGDSTTNTNTNTGGNTTNTNTGSNTTV